MSLLSTSATKQSISSSGYTYTLYRSNTYKLNNIPRKVFAFIKVGKK
jgi:hypothetical protein